MRGGKMSFWLKFFVSLKISTGKVEGKWKYLNLESLRVFFSPF